MVKNFFYNYIDEWVGYNPKWQLSPNLIKEYESLNIIKINKNEDNSFDIYFNNKKEISFNDDTFTGGDSGFYVGISKNQENFPENPVDVRLKIISYK